MGLLYPSILPGLVLYLLNRLSLQAVFLLGECQTTFFLSTGGHRTQCCNASTLHSQARWIPHILSLVPKLLTVTGHFFPEQCKTTRLSQAVYLFKSTAPHI